LLAAAGGTTPAPGFRAPATPIPLAETAGADVLLTERSKLPGLTNPGRPPSPSLVGSTCPRLPCSERTKAHAHAHSFVRPQTLTKLSHPIAKFATFKLKTKYIRTLPRRKQI